MERNVERPENTENFPKISLPIWKAYAKIPSVKLTIGLKLKPTKEQPAALKETIERANEAVNECSHLHITRMIIKMIILMSISV
jgi:hypothetical protein